MIDELFVLGLTLAISLVLSWGFKALPGERWQMLAAIPRRKHPEGDWQGENLTFYGLFTANAYVLAVMIFIVLMGATAASPAAIATITAALLGVCIPASKIVARIVEKKKHTFTVGGASFVGILIAPWIVAAVNLALKPWMTAPVAVMTFMAALSISYAFGEGIGRLACISFGCCYGRPLADCPPLIQRLFRNLCFVFSGKTKKIAYADGWDGRRVLPIQAVTAAIYCASGIAGVYLFLKGFYNTAFFETLLITQIWRSVSEMLRADFRGGRQISAYQIMAMAAVGYAVLTALFQPAVQTPAPDVPAGMGYLWHPAVILSLQVLWAAIFLYTGRSRVTGSALSFHVIRDRI
ncbi:prolipoprotein diacylglyceryl transferase family protein [Desulfococcus sp.]|uniref:prolipoprotein diacylglyceryl transferase family protein n=1 Tax=Desulfococcus sp. TaxID=2025834 RepID=UPI003593B152